MRILERWLVHPYTESGKKISGNIVTKFAIWENHFIFIRIGKLKEGLG
jgi:hypothetical protein